MCVCVCVCTLFHFILKTRNINNVSRGPPPDGAAECVRRTDVQLGTSSCRHGTRTSIRSHTGQEKGTVRFYSCHCCCHWQVSLCKRIPWLTCLYLCKPIKMWRFPDAYSPAVLCVHIAWHKGMLGKEKKKKKNKTRGAVLWRAGHPGDCMKKMM